MKAGDKVYCKSMHKNFVVGHSEGEYATVCIDIDYRRDDFSVKSFGTFIISNNDLEDGWKTKDEIDRLIRLAEESNKNYDCSKCVYGCFYTTCNYDWEDGEYQKMLADRCCSHYEDGRDRLLKMMND